MVKIGYCAGHGINTPGKRTPDGEREWTFNNIVATAFAKELEKYDGVVTKRFDNPTGKTDVPLATRTNGANAWGADYYISFHHNANTSKWGDWTGVETFVYTKPSEKSLELANAVHPALVNGYGLRDRGIKKKNLHIVRETKCPAILLEGGFMDSRIDIKKLRDENVLKNAGKLIAQAFAKFAKLELKEEKKTTTSTTKKTTTKSATQTAKAKEPIGTIKVLVKELNYYDGPRWTKPTGTVKKNTILTVMEKVNVQGYPQYKLKSGTYITASPTYVKFTKK